MPAVILVEDGHIYSVVTVRYSIPIHTPSLHLLVYDISSAGSIIHVSMIVGGYKLHEATQRDV